MAFDKIAPGLKDAIKIARERTWRRFPKTMERLGK